MKCKRGYTLKKGRCQPKKIRCVCDNLKKEINGKNKIWTITLIILAFLVVIILPTGTIDDSFTTIPLIALLGIYKYLILAGIILILFLINFKKIWSLIERAKKGC